MFQLLQVMGQRRVGYAQLCLDVADNQTMRVSRQKQADYAQTRLRAERREHISVVNKSILGHRGGIRLKLAQLVALCQINCVYPFRDRICSYLDSKVHTVITVCGNADQACPIFPGMVKRYDWGFDDPAKATGNEEGVFEVFRRERDEIAKVFGAYAA